MRALILAGGLAGMISLFLTPAFIWLFKKLEWGQFIRDDGPKTHHTKRGTPTMGGLVIVFASTFAYFAAKLVSGETPSVSALLVIFMLVGLGSVGFIDDFMKVRNQRSLGLGGWAKMAGIAVVTVAFAVMALNFPDDRGVTPASTKISLFRDLPIDLMVWGPGIGSVLFALWIYLLVASATNGVNIADGLDGLASGAAIFSIGAYVVIGFWQFNQSCRTAVENISACYTVRDPLDLAVISAAIVGAIIGFLWWNTSPAQIFMGDTGSFAIGGSLAALAVLSRTELLLVLIGGLFVIVTASVVIQRAFFKITKWRTGTGRRVFLMSPLHHHFELKGWAEVTVVVRFWIIGGLSVAAGVGLFYIEWIYGL
jgi:phospho-N-acetylmuramoyl-pentapeptide-transferase